MEILELKYNIEKEGWVCPYCGAVYHRSIDQKPTINWCMKCKREWL